MRTARRLGTRIALALAVGGLAVPAAAHAASVAYIENGNVWIASPDGRTKIQLTTSGTPEQPWRGVAQAPSGLTVGVYDGDPVTRDPRRQRLKVWDRSGLPVRDVALTSRPTPSVPERPQSLEISDDGAWVADEYTYCVPGTTFGTPDACASLARGSWVTATAAGASGATPDLPGFRQGTFLGNRLVASDGQRISVLQAPGVPGTLAADPWIAPAVTLSYRRADVPPAGGKVAVEVFNGALTAKNAIAVVPFTGDAGTGTSDSSQGCTMGAPEVVGSAFAAAWSPDGAQLAWRDDQGVKVGGAPVLPWPSQAPCSLTSAPVLISSQRAKAELDLKDSSYQTTSGPSFGGADAAAMVSARARAKARGTLLYDPREPLIARPRATTATSLRGGLRASVTSAAALPIAGTARIAPALADRLGLPTIVATGKASAAHAGERVTLKLRLTARARRVAARLKGATLTLQAVQAGRSFSRRLPLR